MSLFKGLREAAAIANEEAHAVRLESELQSTIATMQRLTETQQAEIAKRFGVKNVKIRAEMNNWTREGRLRMASFLRNEARKQLDFNIVESYALWFAGAWLESQQRVSAKARAVFAHLDAYALAVAKQLSPASLATESPSQLPGLRPYLGALFTEALLAIVAYQARGPMFRGEEEAKQCVVRLLERDHHNHVILALLGYGLALAVATDHRVPKGIALLNCMTVLFRFGLARPQAEAVMAYMDKGEESPLLEDFSIDVFPQLRDEAHRSMTAYMKNREDIQVFQTVSEWLE